MNSKSINNKTMNSKASSEMWWVIIGAVIALIVLIVLLVLFTGKTRGLEGGLTDCAGKGGVCVASGDCPSNTLQSGTFECSDSVKPQCCVGIPKKCFDDSQCDINKERCRDSYCYSIS